MWGERNAESVDGAIDSRWGGVDICSGQCRGRAFRKAGASRDLFKKDVVRFGRVAADARAEFKLLFWWSLGIEGCWLF